MKRSWPIFLAAVLAGCQANQSVSIIDGGMTKLPSENSALFLNRLSSQPAVSEADALAGFFMVLGENTRQEASATRPAGATTRPGAAPTTFADIVEYLKQRKIVDGAWTFDARRPITKGKVAYMFYQALGVRGGLTLTLLGPSQRYCLLELQYRGLMSPGLPYNDVTGMEMVSVLARADELRQTGKVSEVMRGAEGGSQQP